MSNYSDFSFYYDGLTQNVEYKKRAVFFDSLIRKHCTSGGNYVVDLACGTGSLSEEMSALGYDVSGIDISEEMLNVALDKKYDSGLDIQYICQDMTEFELYGNADVIICALDSINHLSSKEDIEKTIRRAFLFTEPGGLFIFDANTVYKHKNILSDNCFIYENDQVFCAWQNSYFSEDNRVDITLDFFEKSEKGHYSRYTDSFSEITFETEDFIKMITEAGFDLIETFDDDMENPVFPESERIFFVCKKKK